MCGINGILRLVTGAAAIDPEELLRTRDSMASRGPDGDGAWLSPDGAVGLGHRRLAIIDLSPAGAQPMSWAGGRYRIVFNGEIYNYQELRAELRARGVSFRSNSDTEVILALYAEQGLAMLSRLRGMYTLAIWDEVDRRLVLARGPYGIKPLYYAADAAHFRFASQVKALEKGGAISREVDPAGLVGFLLWGSVPEPLTIRKSIRALPAGHYLLVENDRVREPRAFQGLAQGHDAAPPPIFESLDGSVQAHLVSDVPVAIFLSAGLDSSLIAALAVRHLPIPPTTFTVTFDEFVGTGRDEGPLAAEIARTLGTRHVERRVPRAELADLWPACIEAMDQPSVDGFNTFLVSRVAREAGLKVVLSGLGGDELFGSYPSFREVPLWARKARLMRRVPGATRLWPSLVGQWAPTKPKLAGFLEHGGSLPGAYFLRRGLYLPLEVAGIVGEELAREGLAAYDPVRDAERVLRSAGGDRRPGGSGPLDDFEALHFMESCLYMRNQLLRDSDWASMAHSLELRVPLVDARLQRAIAGARFEPARSRGKAALIREVAPALPDSVFTRPKSGFGVPAMEGTAAGGGRSTLGLSSRRLALKVLDAFGIPHRGPRSETRAA